MSDLGECVVVSSGDEKEEDDCEEAGRGAVLRVTGAGATDASAIDVEGLDDDDDDETSESTGESDVYGDSDCEIVSVDGIHGEEKWRNVRGSMSRLNHLIRSGHSDPRVLLTQIFNLDEKLLPCGRNQLWGLLLTLLSEPEPRRRLKHVNSLDKFIDLLTKAKRVLVVTGAGVSVSCGIPDFRSRDGIYARLANDYPDLSSPQAMFDLAYFLRNPEPFFKFAKEIFPGQFMPSLTHRFVALLEERSQLLRNYTQNIDTLEQAAGITRLIQCHGSFATASCTDCKHRVPGDQIKEAIFAQTIPRCPKCLSGGGDDGGGGTGTGSGQSSAVGGVMKPDIVFFGEDLAEEFHDTLAEDIKQADLVLVIGSSLKVRPVAHIPNAVPGHVPQVLINREPLSNHEFDVELLGDCDVIVRQLCLRLGWSLPQSADATDSDQADVGQFRYVPFIELPDCPTAFHCDTNDATDDKSSSKAPQTVDTAETSAAGDLAQVIPNGTELEDGDAKGVREPDAPMTSPGSTGDHPVEITDSDDEEAEKKVEDDDDTWEVAASLPGSLQRWKICGPYGVKAIKSVERHSPENVSRRRDFQTLQKEPTMTTAANLSVALPHNHSAGCFTMISSHQYVFPGAEVYVCKTVKPDLEEHEDTEDSDDDSDSGSGTLSPSSGVDKADAVPTTDGQPSDGGKKPKSALHRHLRHLCAAQCQPPKDPSSPVLVNSTDTTRQEGSSDVGEAGHLANRTPKSDRVGERLSTEALGSLGGSSSSRAPVNAIRSPSGRQIAADPVGSPPNASQVNGDRTCLPHSPEQPVTDSVPGEDSVSSECPAEKRPRLCEPLIE